MNEEPYIFETKTISLRMPPTVAKQLEEMSKTTGVSMNTIVCRAIIAKYDNFYYAREALEELNREKIDLLKKIDVINQKLSQNNW